MDDHAPLWLVSEGTLLVIGFHSVFLLNLDATNRLQILLSSYQSSSGWSLLPTFP